MEDSRSWSYDIAAIYTEQAELYKTFQHNSFAWNYIERPGFDKYVSDFYRSDARILDLCCGSGAVIEHLIDKGVSSRNIVGLDISEGLLLQAQQRLPEVKLVCATAESFNFKPGSFDLVTCNMALHYLDNEQVAHTLDSVYNVLSDKGIFFIVDTDPDFRIEVDDDWTEVQTPWGETHPLFNRNLRNFLLDTAYYGGFDQRAGWTLAVAEEARLINEPEYQRYTNGPSRLGVRLQKVSVEEKASRLLNMGKMAPSWTN